MCVCVCVCVCVCACVRVGGLLHPFTWAIGKNENPIPAVFLSWFLVQVCSSDMNFFLGVIQVIFRSPARVYLYPTLCVNM